MSATETYLAIDLGAGSGRVMAAAFDGERIALDELHRFPNHGVRTPDGLHWDVLRLFEEIQAGARLAGERRPASLGVDAWGVDFALLDRTGALVGNPFHYRDGRTQGKLEEALSVVGREEIFEHTGLQFMEINSLYQLLAMKGSPALEIADALLMTPDLFGYWLSGEKACELTDATTTQFFDPRRRDWARGLLDKLGLPSAMLQPVIEPGTRLGPLAGGAAETIGFQATVVACAGHDTASAVAAVPAEPGGEDGDWAFLSSGTWSLLGAEVSRPYVTPEALARNFTNEGGVAGTTRLLKNISGLWILEECRRIWEASGETVDYETVVEEAAAAPPFRSLIDVDDAVFTPPGDMPGRIARWCGQTGQPAPRTHGELARAIFESLALKYRATLADLAAITGRPPRTLHIVGGGSRNALLNQFAADASGLPVVAGPVEATALGNALVQAIAMGRVRDGAEAREIVRRSTSPERYEPGPGNAWAEAGERLAGIIADADRGVKL